MKVAFSSSIVGPLFLIFLTLKLLDKIDWSWWWVTAPLWIPSAIFAVVAAGCFLLAGVLHLVDRSRRR